MRLFQVTHIHSQSRQRPASDPVTDLKQAAKKIHGTPMCARQQHTHPSLLPPAAPLIFLPGHIELEVCVSRSEICAGLNRIYFDSGQPVFFIDMQHIKWQPHSPAPHPSTTRTRFPEGGTDARHHHHISAAAGQHSAAVARSRVPGAAAQRFVPAAPVTSAPSAGTARQTAAGLLQATLVLAGFRSELHIQVGYPRHRHPLLPLCNFI